MKVKELMEWLSELPSDADVRVLEAYGEWYTQLRYTPLELNKNIEYKENLKTVFLGE